MHSDLHSLGVIHGRFQVLHNDHLRYLMAGFERCRHLVIGVTNPDPTLTRDEESDPARGSAGSNPLTYFERYVMVRAALTGAGVNHGDFSVVPMPINCPELYTYYVPMDAVFFLTIYDDWGRAKLARFRGLGLKTEVLWEKSPEDKGLAGTEVRRAMAEGGEWRPMVPPSVAALLEEWGVPERIRRLDRDG